MKLLRVGGLLFAAALTGLTPAAALDDDGDVSKYVVVVKNAQLKNAAGDWIMIDKRTRTVSFPGDEPVVSVVNKGTIPPGTYTNFKITLEEKARFAGFMGANKTKAGGDVVYAATAAKSSDVNFPGDILAFNEIAPSWTTSDEAPGMMTIHFDLDYQDRDDIIEVYARRGLKRYLEIDEESKVDIFMRFELLDQVKFAWPGSLGTGMPVKEAMYMMPPKVKEVTVRVDGAISLLLADGIEVLY